MWALGAPVLMALPGQSQDQKPPAQQPKLKQKQKQAKPAQVKEEEPPEEDESLKPAEYTFNPLQASKEMSAGRFYLKKGNYRAAARRFVEATRWNPNDPEAFLLLGEAREKAKDHKAAREAYQKYLALAPDSKQAAEVRKKLAKL